MIQYDQLDHSLRQILFVCRTMEIVRDDEAHAATLAYEAFTRLGRVPKGVSGANGPEKVSAAADVLFRRMLKRVVGLLGRRRATEILNDAFACPEDECATGDFDDSDEASDDPGEEFDDSDDESDDSDEYFDDSDRFDDSDEEFSNLRRPGTQRRRWR